MHLCKIFQKGAFTNSVDPDETPLNAASHQGLRYLPFKHILETVNNTKSYMNHDQCVLKPLKGFLETYITPKKIDTHHYCFSTHIL